MTRIRKILLAALAAALVTTGLLAWASHRPASQKIVPAVPKIYNNNEWSGWIASKIPSAQPIVAEANWYVPKITCNDGDGNAIQLESNWVGENGAVGRGLAPASYGIQQTGTTGQCQAGTRNIYYAWYLNLGKKLKPSHILTETVEPGDYMFGYVGYAKGVYTVQLADLTRNWRVTEHWHIDHGVKSLEVMTEAPESLQTKKIFPLADFGEDYYYRTSGFPGADQVLLENPDYPYDQATPGNLECSNKGTVCRFTELWIDW